MIETGQFRIVRRMMAAVGLPVIHLHRNKVGPFELADLNIPNRGEVIEGRLVFAVFTSL